MTPAMRDFLDYLKREIASERESLHQMELGSLRTGERRAGGEWRDTTEEDMRRIRKGIEAMQRVISAHEGTE